jgi:GH15 family glucan-1,4-alpha-glucosidase
MRLEDLGLIGNCQFSAHVDRRGEVVWCCLPRFDSDPIFARLLDEESGGGFLVGPADGSSGEQRYLENTNVLETTFRGADGAFRVLDFAPRFYMHDRVFRPTMLLRIIEPVEGSPRVVVRCNPVLGWTRRAPERLEGSNQKRMGDIPEIDLETGGFARGEQWRSGTWRLAIPRPHDAFSETGAIPVGRHVDEMSDEVGIDGARRGPEFDHHFSRHLDGIA